MELAFFAVDWEKVSEIVRNDRWSDAMDNEEIDMGLGDWKWCSGVAYMEMVDIFPDIRDHFPHSMAPYLDKIFDELINVDYRMPRDLHLDADTCIIAEMSPETVKRLYEIFQPIDCKAIDVITRPLLAELGDDFIFGPGPNGEFINMFSNYLQDLKNVFQFALDRKMGIMVHLG